MGDYKDTVLEQLCNDYREKVLPGVDQQLLFLWNYWGSLVEERIWFFMVELT
ncbi:hypothetical protein [Peribacillus simplex]|uniref:Uncharacterized protein n=1 Tax=Peribacillus simplex TaxID=1478 RepID=A0AAW7I736_9BACI|nr:hypothetical protein [Peribacillus simplex]MDM5451863.1 hypothetical protein [Peribacillus simplex]